MNDKTTEEMIIEKGLTAPRVTKKLIDSKIVKKEVIKAYTPSGTKIYIGLYAMENGFSVTGKPIVFEGELRGELPYDMQASIITHKTISGSILRFAYTEYPSGLLQSVDLLHLFQQKMTMKRLERKLLLKIVKLID